MSAAAYLPAPEVAQHGRRFRTVGDPLVRAAAAEFCSGFEEGTLRFLDAALPRCDRMVDFGAYIGFTALYAATFGVEVFAFEPSRVNHALLVRNVQENPDLATRIRLFRHGVGDRDEEVPLYAKGMADSGTSVFRDVERGGVVRGRPDVLATLRDAGAVLRELGVDSHTLVKIDIEGAEYRVLPAIASTLVRARPWLQVSFHPFNLVADDPYATALMRLRSTMEAAQALACYRYMHLWSESGWFTVEREDRMDFLRQYLLVAKRVQRVATPQYGFVEGVAFSEEPWVGEV